MSEYMTVWRAKVAEGDVRPLVDVEPKATAEAKRLCPELLGTDLVNLGDGTWLHVLRWSEADSVERLIARGRGVRPGEHHARLPVRRGGDRQREVVTHS